MLPTTTYGYVRLTKDSNFKPFSVKRKWGTQHGEKYEGKVVMFDGCYCRDDIKEMLWNKLRAEGLVKGDFWRKDKEGYCHMVRDNDRFVRKHFRIFCWQ